MFFRIDDENLFQKYKTIWIRIEDFKNNELNALPFCDDRYIKTKIRTYGDKVHTNFRGLNMPENYIDFESFTVVSIDFLLVYENKYYLQVYCYNCDYKSIDKQMIYYFWLQWLP